MRMRSWHDHLRRLRVPGRGPLLLWYLLLVIWVVWLWQLGVEQMKVQPIPYGVFKQHLQRGEVVEAVVRPGVIEGVIDPKPATETGHDGDGARHCGRNCEQSPDRWRR